MLLGVVTVVSAVVVIVVVAPWRPVEGSPPTSGVADPARVAELKRQEELRGARNLEDLGEFAARAQERLSPLLGAMHAALPTDGSAPVQTNPAQVDGWSLTAAQVGEDAERLPTGSTENNIVRSGFQQSVGLLGDSVAALALAAELEGEPAERARVLAATSRDRAVQVWSIAAMQLDTLSIDAGRGHLHVYLPLRPGDALDGGLDELHDGSEPLGSHGH